MLGKMDHMTELEIEEYSQHLANRRSEAKILPRAEIIGGDWQPEPNKCHHNATTWCDLNEDFSPVRGWLYFDLPLLEHIKFIAHSAVLSPEGKIFDITPSNATQDYPFLESHLDEEVYAELVGKIEKGELNVLPKNA